MIKKNICIQTTFNQNNQTLCEVRKTLTVSTSCPLPSASEPPTLAAETTCATGEGEAYRGTISVTESGKTCQSWSVQTPHKHNHTPDNYPCKYALTSSFFFF